MSLLEQGLVKQAQDTYRLGSEVRKDYHPK
jgi:hypothetical protein